MFVLSKVINNTFKVEQAIIIALIYLYWEAIFVWGLVAGHSLVTTP